jgi:acyl-coenzyme A thioesterase PaaI-like protein
VSASAPGYPPDRHLLRDLRIVIDRATQDPGGRDAVARLEICPEIMDASGRLRVGVIATLVDVIAGETAIRSVRPNWTATSNLSVYVDQIPTRGAIQASAQVLRSGRRSVVLEATLRGGEAGGEASREAQDAFAVAQIGFAVLPARGDFQSDTQSDTHWASVPAVRTEFGLADSGFEKPLLETMGIEFDDRDASISRLRAIPSYLINSLDALQGGAVAILAEAAAERFAAATLGGFVRVRSLAIHYLELGRIGPIRTQCRRIARTRAGLLVRVSLFDEGAADLLLSVAMIQVDEVDAVT